MTDKKINKITFSNTYNNPQLDSIKKGEDTFNSVFSEEDQLQQLKEEEEKLIAQLQKGGGQNEIKQLAEIKKEIQTLKNQIEEEKETNAKELDTYSKEISEKELDALEKQISLEKASKMTPQEEKRRKAAQEFYNKKQNSFLNLSKEEQETLEKDTVGTLELLLNSGKETIAEQDKEDGIIARGANKVREFFGGKTTKQKVEAQFQTQENFINELKEADSPEKFAQIYKENTGVEFNPEKIQKFNETKNYSTIANAGLAKCSDFQEALKKETFTGQELINATRKFYGCSQDEAITKLNEYAKSEKGGKYSFDKNGNLSVTSTVYAIKGPTEITKTYKPNEVGSEIKSHKEGDIISQAYSGFNGYAQYCTDQYNKNFEKATGKSIKEISEDYSKYAKEALGTSGFNGELVNKYCEKQETVADRVSSGVSIAGMTMMVGGYATAPVTAGASIAVAQVGTGMALGGQFLDEGLDLVDEVTSENGLSKEEGLALLKETATDAALVSSGFAINKVSSGVNELVLTKMGSKVIAKAAEVGADASLGIYADYIITGDVDLTGEGISQGISIITGISMGKLAAGKVKTTKPTQPDFQKISPNSNDFEINGTVIKNPKKTQTQIPETKNISEMNIFEKTVQGINETSPKKIILSDSIETQKPLILGDETSSQKIIFGDEYNTDTSRYPTRDGYKEKQYIYPTAKGYGSREIEFDSVENTFKTTEIKGYSENWNMKGKDTKVIDTKYTKEGALKSKTTRESHSTYDQNSKEVIKGETLVSENYIDGSKIKAEYIVDDAENKILKSQVKTYKNPKTGLPETHIMELSDVDGIFNSKIIDANGNEKIECFAQKDGGTTKVEKNLESLNGTKTHYTYESKLDGDDVKMFYQITSKDGEVLSTIDRTFTRIDENTATSEINGHRYTMAKTKDGIEVQDIARGTTTEVKYSSVLSDYTDKEMRMLMDKMSGDQLLDLAKQGTKLTTSHVNNSFYKFSENEIISENNLFVYSHEAGHAKDISVNKADNYSRDYAISSEKQFRETFEKEKAEFKKAFPDVQEDYINYFIKGPYNDAVAGTGETVAEINAMFSTATGANELAIRTYELQKYFPETIAMASRKLNTDSNIAISGDTKLNPSTNEQFIPQTNNSTRKIAYNKPVIQNQAIATETSTKLKNFEISEKDFENSVKAFGEEETYKNIEILNQLKNLNMFRNANLTLED
ncbi:MAG: hypothetical protein MJ229_06190, partial [bacterium]|nr:hypothetical protein [bacterium]